MNTWSRDPGIVEVNQDKDEIAVMGGPVGASIATLEHPHTAVAEIMITL